jgi:hypothetical protein
MAFHATPSSNEGNTVGERGGPDDGVPIESFRNIDVTYGGT